MTKNIKIPSKKNCAIFFATFTIFFIVESKFRFASNVINKRLRNVIEGNCIPIDIHKQKSFKRLTERERLKDNMKTILFWTPQNYDPLYYLKEKGQKGFMKLKCKVNNCYATDDRNLFGTNNLTQFDAIVFNGQAFKHNESWSDLPQRRSEHQIYIFYESESSGQFPLCSDKFDNFFNWTMTYRLDSDIPCPFIVVKNKTGQVVGPKVGMVWEKTEYTNLKKMIKKSKKKAAAWFPFDCTRQNPATIYSSLIKQELGSYEMDLDVYGDCGPLACVRGNRECDYLKRDYFYILAMENSMAKDYVTDKVLVALQNDVVPIVYGGANYSNFLPPNSYLDGTILTPTQIAKQITISMQSYILNPINDIYQLYFAWKAHYTYHKAEQGDNLCALCAAVNDKEKTKQKTVYKYLRKWWNSDYREACDNLEEQS